MMLRSHLRLFQILAIVFSCGCAATASEAPLRPTVAPSENLYTNPVYRWSISFPSRWTIDSGDLSFVKIASSADNALCGIHSGAVPFKTVDEFTDITLANNERYFRDRGQVFVISSRRRLSLPNDIIGNDVLTGIGVGGVDSAIRPARKIIGQAVTNGTVDTFIVHSPRVGGPIPFEGGLSACAEAGFGTNSKKFNAFIKQIRSIRPSSGIYVNVEPVSNCGTIAPLSCGGITGAACPSNQICVDDPNDSCDPTTGGADCSGTCAKPDVCTADVKQCPDGSYVSRVLPGCGFAPCPGEKAQ